jgi:hypothetical protein
MKRLLVLAAMVFSTTLAAAQQPALNNTTPAPGALPEVPIVILADGLDACPSNGIVEGLDPAGDGFLAVRSGPSANHAVLDHLHNDDLVYICRTDGDWHGVVYIRDPSTRCNTSSAWTTTQPYTGPCYSGWVHRKWINIYAG